MKRRLWSACVFIAIMLSISSQTEAQLFTFNFDDQNLLPADINSEPMPISVSGLSFLHGSYGFVQDPALNYNLELRDGGFFSMTITVQAGYVMNLSHIYWEEMSTAEISPKWIIEVETRFDGERDGWPGFYTMELTRENSLPTWRSHDWALSQVPAYHEVNYVLIYFGILPDQGGPGPMLFDNFVLTGSVTPVPEIRETGLVAAIGLLLWAIYRPKASRQIRHS